MNILAQANHIYEERGHVGLRNTKTRSEVNRTTKKIYAQKGTGGARHGSRRANLYVGGGIIFGPRPLRRILTLPQSQKRAALLAAFSAKAKAGEIVVLRGITSIAKTAEVGKFIDNVAKELKHKRFTFLLSDGNLKNFKFFRNLKDATTVLYKSTNAFDIIGAGQVVIDEEVFETKKEEVKTKSVKKEATTKKGAVAKSK
jgi:large subunit ribosomal protein L4